MTGDTQTLEESESLFGFPGVLTLGSDSVVSDSSCTDGNAPLPHSCRCNSRWTGVNVCHCAGCHVSFSSLSGFEKHRSGTIDDRRCEYPESVGLRPVQRRGFLVWSFPDLRDWTGR